MHVLHCSKRCEKEVVSERFDWDVETVATGRIKLSKLDPLDWWQENKTKYPHIAVLARKWLSVPATSTPSERVFSICGIVNTAKRSKMNGKSIENQVLIHNNQSVLS